MFRRKKEEVYDISISGIPIQVSRKRIKNLYVRVNRFSGIVRVSCPIRISETALKQFIISKYDWIQRQRVKAETNIPHVKLEYKNGEKVLLGGKKYQLDVKVGASKSGVEIFDGYIILKISGTSTVKKRAKVLENYYRTRLKALIPDLVRKYEPMMGVYVEEFRIKKMKTRWGTCNIKDRRIWLNLELAKKTEGCLEMVVVHEMVHLLERLHNKRFYKLMDNYMPDWRIFNEELNSSID